MSVAVLLCELLAVGALYAGGVRRVRRWPAWRAACFGAGLLALAVALVGMDAIADASLTGHMAQHLVLVFVAAPLLVLGSPMALALRATGRAARHVTGARALAHPLLGWATLPLVMAARREPRRPETVRATPSRCRRAPTSRPALRATPSACISTTASKSLRDSSR